MVADLSLSFQELIDKVLDMLQNADPTGEGNPDPPDMTTLESKFLRLTIE